MTATSVDPLFKGSTGRDTRGLLRLVILCTIAAAAVASRLFSVISTYSNEQQLHEWSRSRGSLCEIEDDRPNAPSFR